MKIAEYMDRLREGTVHLVKMSEQLNYPWTSDEKDPRKLHNMYARSLITCYVSKFAQLSESILGGVEDQRYMVYAMSGRAIIETVATLRYYLLEQYKPILDKASLSMEDMQKLIDIDDQHLRGSRFDWESFFSQRYDKLILPQHRP